MHASDIVYHLINVYRNIKFQNWFCLCCLDRTEIYSDGANLHLWTGCVYTTCNTKRDNAQYVCQKHTIITKV